MSEVKSCAYNPDTESIDVTYADGRKMSVLCNRIEETLELTLTMQSKFDWLIYNEPETLVDLYLSGELEDYLEWYDKAYLEQETGIRKQLEQHFDLATARALAREFMMYDS